MRGDPWNHRRSFETEVKNRRLVPIDLGKIPVSVVLIGNSNSGKSTTTGHLVYKLVGIEDESTMERLNKLKYAWIVDKLKVERERGITIDANFCKIETINYLVTLIDALGHWDYLINMINGTTQVDCSSFSCRFDPG
ncbi:elongation factor 1-alpha [Tanacetum coccineum]